MAVPPPALLFAETQRATRHWWGAALAGPTLAWGLWYGGIAPCRGWAEAGVLAAVALMPLLLLWPLQLHTRLDAAGVWYRYPPLLGK